MSFLSKTICYIVLGIDWKFHMKHFFHKTDFTLNQYFPYEDIDYSIFCVRASQNIAFGFVKLEHFISSWVNMNFDLAQPWCCFPWLLSPWAMLCSRITLSVMHNRWSLLLNLLFRLTMVAQVGAGFYASFQNLHIFYFIKIFLSFFYSCHGGKKLDISNFDAKADEKKYGK